MQCSSVAIMAIYILLAKACGAMDLLAHAILVAGHEYLT